MMSVFDQFGKRKNEPHGAMPTVTRPTPAPGAQHEKTAQALAFVTRLNEEADWLREENGRLQADLNLTRLRCADLERVMHEMRADLEKYRNYAVEVRTHLQHIVDSAQRANEAALVAGESIQHDEHAARTIERTEREVRLAAEEIGGKYGANGSPPTSERAEAS